MRTRNELRCICCSRSPLLATYGLDEFGRVYVHIKVYKNHRIYGEILVEQGSKVKIRCRDCLRWYTLTVGVAAPRLEQTDSPNQLDAEVS